MRIKKRAFGKPHGKIAYILAAPFDLLSVFDRSASHEKIPMNVGWKFIKRNPSAAFEHVLMDETGTSPGENKCYLRNVIQLPSTLILKQVRTRCLLQMTSCSLVLNSK